MQNTNLRLKNLSFQLEITQAQLDFTPTIMDVQTNNQSTEEGVDKIEKDIMLEGCGIMKIVEEIDMSHEV